MTLTDIKEAIRSDLHYNRQSAFEREICERMLAIIEAIEEDRRATKTEGNKAK